MHTRRADAESESDFQLIAGTNRDLKAAVAAGRFREDLRARINLWTFALPSLKDRIEDLEPNLAYELEKHARTTGKRVTFNKEALQRFLAFATSGEAAWAANFRDLNAAVTRMATLAHGGRITEEEVRDEIARLSAHWSKAAVSGPETALERILGPARIAQVDRFDRVQLADVVEVCRNSRTLSDAGRILFAESRKRRTQVNDADRLRKYLARFDLGWEDVRR